MVDGNTLVGAASQGRLLVVNPESKIVKTIPVRSPPGHSCMRNARQIENGHFLVAEESAHAAREYSAEGELVRDIKLSFAPFSVVRLENGNTVICGEQTMVVMDAADKIIWSVKGDELPELGIRWFAGIQVLPEGNFFVCNAGGKVPFLEISPDKQVVWRSPAGMSIPVRRASCTADGEELIRVLQESGIEGAERFLHGRRGPIAAVLHTGLARARKGPEAVEKAITIAASVETAQLERGLIWLATVANIAPLLGFLGTVSGMIHAFEAIAAAEEVSAKLVATGRIAGTTRSPRRAASSSCARITARRTRRRSTPICSRAATTRRSARRRRSCRD
jgi:hypothetical protein